MKLVLASTSAYRKMLLERLHVPFDTDRPETDETPLPGEAPAATAERLAADDAGRALTREATWQGALAYWPLGSGLGSYAWVFPRFQAPEVGRYWLDLAHNDYLQLLMETGLLGLAAMMLALALVGRRALQLARAGRGRWSSADRLAVACGLGLLATLLHAWVDYPFRIPANAMLAACLLGVLLRETPAEPVGP